MAPLVVERAPQRRSSGYMVNLLGSGYDAAERLGLIPALSERAVGLFTTVLVRADGRPKLTMPSTFAEAALGARTVMVFRGDLEATLYEAAREHAEFRFPRHHSLGHRAGGRPGKGQPQRRHH